MESIPFPWWRIKGFKVSSSSLWSGCFKREIAVRGHCSSHLLVVPFSPDDADTSQKERLPWPMPGYLLCLFRWQHFLGKGMPSTKLRMSAAPGLWAAPHYGECIACSQEIFVDLGFCTMGFVLIWVSPCFQKPGFKGEYLCFTMVHWVANFLKGMNLVSVHKHSLL